MRQNRAETSDGQRADDAERKRTWQTKIRIVTKGTVKISRNGAKYLVLDTVDAKRDSAKVTVFGAATEHCERIIQTNVTCILR